jgi:hypothetical protein
MLIQPDILEWVRVKHVGFRDVPSMTMFPLHPIKHLHGNISSIVEYGYSTDVLLQLGITYLDLRVIHMDDHWMKAMNLPVKDWKQLGMSVDDLPEITCVTVFGKTSMQLRF